MTSVLMLLSCYVW